MISDDLRIQEFYQSEIEEIETEYRQQAVLFRNEYGTKMSQLIEERTYNIKKLHKELFGTDQLLTVDDLMNMLDSRGELE